MRQVAPVPRPRRSRPPTPPTSFFGRFNQAVTRLLGNPVLLVVLGLTIALALTHAGDPFSEIVTKIASQLSSLPATKWLGDFLAAHVMQTVGAIALTVAVLTSARPSEKTAYVLGAVAFAYLIPEWSVWTYGVLSVILALFLQMRTVEDRLLLAAIAGVVYVLAAGKTPVPPPTRTKQFGG